MTEFLITFLVGASTFAIVVMLQELDGPFDILLKFRGFVGIYYVDSKKVVEDSVFAKLFSCPWCLSVWISLPILVMLYIIIGRDVPIALFPFLWASSISVSVTFYALMN